jgi:hypothetical protein
MDVTNPAMVKLLASERGVPGNAGRGLGRDQSWQCRPVPAGGPSI